MVMIRNELTRSSHDIRRVHELVHEGFLVLLRSIKAKSTSDLVPVIVLRGGLLAYRSAVIVFGGPIGLIAPRGNPPYDQRTYGDVPLASSYLVIDTIANRGDTLMECVLGLRSKATGAEVHTAFLFGTTEACSKLERISPMTNVDVAWPDFARGEDGRLIGVNYDAGDYAMMDPHGNRLTW
jgi:hypothetical protein